MVMPEGDIPLHELLPEEKQDAMTRLDAVLDELLVRHDYPEDVQELIVARMREWSRKWADRGVHRSRTFAEFHSDNIPGFLKEAWSISQQINQREASSGNQTLPPGRKVNTYLSGNRSAPGQKANT